ncbi:MAG: hypothetical protein A2X25_01025 [Chloroflexi bacterium GWB2_49_20]|nr:MAG: hypothetical protein A2X25_01025 [Chloroflexi bacterium GWB2_49_20]OGN78700.1 MAG: hypothetical protein A2X26_07855 [Chloroflexi bacterium GWC2_49_37]OGN85341.1 MAG: hypothetical protein A2X27_03385 [Chloroflexi bacterium GWD2_49_16]HBG73831.1 hypothetical protein [Anaerolineae bacterium]HCC79421.1 hypothetical protein [Anaerolineae bacterium]
MKNKVIVILAVMIALVLVTTQVNASQLGNQPQKTPGAAATRVAELHAAGQYGNPNSDPNGKPNGKPENYRGTISAVDGTSITLDLKNGSQVTILLDEQTRIRIPTVKDATYEDLEPGMNVMVQARRVDASLTAKAVALIPGKPAKVHRVGIVTVITSDSITIQDKKGDTFTFLINADTKILPAERAELLAVDARVTIISPRDVAGGEALAAGIVVHPPVEGDD